MHSKLHIYSKLVIILYIVILAVPPFARALPEGHNVESGEVDFAYPDEHTLNITADDKAVINFNSFNINENETVNFIQPSEIASVLSRVVGNDPSRISGALNANGILFLVNSNGIYFTPTSEVNVNALIASTLDINTNNFINSNYVFEHIPEEVYAQILNEGIIQGDNIALISASIDNKGIIIAKLGTVNLASGDKTIVSFDREGLIQVEVTEETSGEVFDINGNKVKDAVSNTGTIEARDVIITSKVASDIFENAVNLDGIVKATGISEEGGIIKIISNDKVKIEGKLEATKKIDIQAEKIQANPQKPLETEQLNITANNIIINTQAQNLEIYKPTGDILITGSYKNNDLVTIEGEDISVTYFAAADLTLKSNGGIDTRGEAVITAKTVKLISNKFGTQAMPLSVEADSIHIRSPGQNIAIFEMLGIGTSILMRGPPDGFGAIEYPKDAHLILEADKVSLSGPEPLILYGDATIHNLYVDIPNKEINFEADKTFTFLGNVYIKGEKGYDGLIKLFSSQEGIPWYSDFTNATDIDISFVAIRDAHNIGETVYAEPATNWGNSLNWDTDPSWEGDDGGNPTWWNVGENWSLGAVPANQDAVSFDSTSNNDCLVNNVGTWTGGSLTITGDYGGVVTVGTAMTIGAFSQAGGTFDCTNQAVNIDGNTAISGGIFMTGTGVVTFGDNNAVDTVTISSGELQIESDDTTATGDIQLNLLSWTNSGGTIIYNDQTGASTSLLSALSSYYDLEINANSSTTYTLDGIITVSNDFTLTDGDVDTDDDNDYAFNANRDWLIDGGNFDANDSTITIGRHCEIANVSGLFTRGGSTIDLTGSGNLSCGNTSNPFHDINAAANSQTTTLTGTVRLNGLLTLGDGTAAFDTDGNAVQMIGSGTMLSTSGATISGNGDFLYFAQGGDINVIGTNYGANDLEIQGASANYELTAELTTTGNITIYGNVGATATFNTNDNTISANSLTVGANWVGTRYGAFNAGSSTVTFTGSVTQHNASSSMDLGSATITVGNDWTINGGTVDPDASTVIFNGDGTAQVIESAGTSFNNIQLGTATEGANVSTADALDIDGTLTVLDGGATTLDITDDTVTAASTFNLSNLDTFTTDASTVEFNGAGAQSITSNSKTYNTIEVTNGTGNDVTFEDAFSTTNFTAQTPSTSLKFNENTTFTISGTLTLNGQATDTRVALDSEDGANRFTFNVTGGPQNVSYVNVSNSNASGNNITTSNSLNGGNNDNNDTPPRWIFPSAGTADSGEAQINLSLQNCSESGFYERFFIPDFIVLTDYMLIYTSLTDAHRKLVIREVLL